MKQTAVEWLFAHLLPFLEFSDVKERWHFRKCLIEAKEIEREKIKDAYKAGFNYRDEFNWEGDCTWEDKAHFNDNEQEFQKYYNEVYKGGEQ
jgi:hypothetical protein